MRLRLVIAQVLLFVALFGLASAWTEEDYEIFRLRDEVAQTEGADVTFYDFLGVKPSVSRTGLVKSYRQKSKSLHPDKIKRAFIANYRSSQLHDTTANANANANAKAKQKPAHASPRIAKDPSEREISKAIKGATERYARLAVVRDILASPARRDRYDHFLKHGFPIWKGTGYYYSRFRPGLGSVLIGLWLAFGGAAHYAVLVLGWNKRRDFVLRYIRDSRRAAWGSESSVGAVMRGAGSEAAAVEPATSGRDGEAETTATAPMAMNRRQKRMLDKENKSPGKKEASSSSSSSSTGKSQNRQEQKLEKEQQSSPSSSSPSSSTAATTPTPTPTANRRRIVAPNGKILIVDSVGNVFLEEETEDGDVGEFLLDPDEIARPTVRDTAVVQLPLWMFNRTIGRVLGFRLSGGANGDYEVNDAAADGDGDGDGDGDDNSNGSAETGEEGERPAKTTSRRKAKLMRQRRAARSKGE